MGLITLLTDFGARDWFVGTMKGVILRIAPNTVLVDITHDIPPGDIAAGAFALAASSPFFPPQTVHLAVVDPGVGTPRPAVVVQTRSACFVGPDNGLLTLALKGQEIRGIRRLENPEYALPSLSHTFHGRDLFAPAAAHLSRGLPPARLGPAWARLASLPWPEPTSEPQGWRGQVVYVDHFGNAITNLPNHLAAAAGKRCRLRFGNNRSCPIGSAYASVPLGRPVGIPGSTGFLEIAVHQGHAARKFRLKPGSRVQLRQLRSSRP